MEIVRPTSESSLATAASVTAAARGSGFFAEDKGASPYAVLLIGSLMVFSCADCKFGDSLLRSSRCSHLPMLLGQHGRRSNGRDGRLKFVLHTGDHIALAIHHGFEADARHFVGIHFFLRTYLGIQHVG